MYFAFLAGSSIVFFVHFFVTLELQADWKALLDRVIDGELDGMWAMMKPGLPMGPDGRPEHPIKADYLKPVIEKFRVDGRPFKRRSSSRFATNS